MTDRDFILAPQMVTVSVALEPVYNALTSFMLLSGVEHQSGFSDWVVKTAASLSPERQRINRIVFGGLSLINATLPDESWPSLPEWLAHLEDVVGEPSIKRLIEQNATWVSWRVGLR